MAKKKDIRLIDWVQKEVGLSDVQREILHEEIRAAGEPLSREQLLDLAREIAELYQNSILTSKR